MPSNGGRGFSRESAPPRLSLAACGSCTVGPRPGRFLRPAPATPFNALFRQRARVSLLRLRSAYGTPGCGISTACPSARPSPAGVRSRLTLNRLALFRNPWSFGEGVSRPLCRYLYLHLLFRSLQQVSRPVFAGGGMLPYQSIIDGFHVFGTGLMPDYYPCGAARLVSCYALFK